MTEPAYYRFTFEELGINKSCIEYTMGFSPGEAPPPFNEIIDEVLEHAGNYCNIQGAIQNISNLSVDEENKKILLDHTAFQTGDRITSLLAQAESAALFIVTAGKGIEQWMQECQARDDTFSSYVIDVVGSETADLAALHLQRQLEKELQKSDQNVSDPYSPGYSGWPVSDQKALFSFFPSGSCGIQLTESSLMDPIKSISGIIGIGKNVQRDREDYCSHCENTSCIYRHRRHRHQ